MKRDAMPLRKYDETEVLRIHVKHLDRRLRATERLVERLLQQTVSAPSAPPQPSMQECAKAAADAATHAATQAITEQLASVMLRHTSEKTDDGASTAAEPLSTAVAPLGHMRQRTIF